MRFNESWKPKVEHIARGELCATFFPGTVLDVLLQKRTLELNGCAVDADVTRGRSDKQVRCRRCGVPAPNGSYRFYLNNLPPRVGPHQVSDLYRVRWEIRKASPYPSRRSFAAARRSGGPGPGPHPWKSRPR